MSEIAPAKCRVEIFPKPYFFDDHFQAGWSISQGVLYTDGDLGQLTIGPTFSSASMTRTVNFHTNTYRYLVIRATALTGTSWVVRIRRADTSEWITVATYVAPGLAEIDLQAFYYGAIDRVQIAVYGSNPQYVDLDYVSSNSAPLVTPVAAGDVVEDLTITRPLLSQGISGAKLTIPNFEGAFNGAINKHDVIIIWLARNNANLGDPVFKVFGGRVAALSNEGRGQGAFFIKLDCHGHAYELINPPALLQKLYFTINGRTIIEDALALCNYVTRHPNNSMWFDAGGASGSTDDRINSTHDVEYDEVVPKTVIDEICDKASNPAGVKGFDIVEMPSGVLIGHLRNSLDFTSPISSITPETYSKSEDTYRVKNKNKVYGKAGKIGVPGDEGRKEPFNGDEWTLDDVNNWTVDLGSIAEDTMAKKVGSNSLRIYTADYSGVQKALVRRNIENVVLAFGKGAYQTINFWIMALNQNATHKLRLYAPDSSNYFETDIQKDPYDWKFNQFQLGKNQEYDSEKNPNGIWTKIGSPKWGDLRYVAFYIEWSVAYSPNLDGLYFGHGRWRGSAENATSQSQYGTRCLEPEVDEALGSDTECTARALSLVAFFKDPVVSLENVLVDGDRYTPGDRQRVIVSNDNYDADPRIIEVQHKIRGVTWDAILKLSNEPVYIDYVFHDLITSLKRSLRRG